MPDVWATIATLDVATQERLAAVLETRGADLQQRAMRHAFLADITIAAQSRVLEVGCGTGVLTRILARWPEVAEVVGVDLSAALLSKARELAADLPNVTFQEANGRALPFPDASFDIVVFDSALSHIPGPERALGEAFRVLRPLGSMAAFDGDYATPTVALGEDDPLQACVETTFANSVTDRYLVRRLPGLMRSSGFVDVRVRSHGFVETEGGYMLTVIDRGADFLQSFGQIGEEMAETLKAEARQRVAAGRFFGHVAYGSLIARKPA
jgi:ubiquinone/menaquinone biosynthesis C-methylase UbiE